MSEAVNKVVHLSLSRRALMRAATAGVASAAVGRNVLRGIQGAAAQEGATGGTLIVGKPYELTGYDPHVDANQTSWEIHAVVYQSLLFLDDNLVPVPGLAESWETPDDRTYVFKLRQGVKFHNGREMTAADVLFSLQRLLTYEEAWWDTKMGPPRQLAPAELTAVAAGTPAAGPSVGLTVEATGPYDLRTLRALPRLPDRHLRLYRPGSGGRERPDRPDHPDGRHRPLPTRGT